MSKELPYFKFFCDEWITGDITLEPYSIQGLFISICAYYWKQNCNITFEKLKRRFKDVEEKTWNLLIKNNYIKDSKGIAEICFLSEQWEDYVKINKNKQKAGRLGALKRWGSNGRPIVLPLAENSRPTILPMAEHGNKEVDKEVDKDKDKDKDKEIKYKDVFDYYLTLNLKKHKIYTDAMRDSIKRFMTKTKSSIDDCKKCLDRHVTAIENTKKKEYPITARGLAEFFGQKVYQGTELIAEQYLDGGKHSDIKNTREPRWV